MNDHDTVKKLCSRLLSAYGIHNEVYDAKFEDLKIYRSNMYGSCSVYNFHYMNRDFLVSDDYSLMDDPKYIKAVLEDATELRDGKLIENPIQQNDGAKYALGLDGTEYYLWESSPA